MRVTAGIAIACIFVFHAVICSVARGVDGRVAVNGCAVRFIILPYRRKSLNLGSPCIHHRRRRRTSSGMAVSVPMGQAGFIINGRRCGGGGGGFAWWGGGLTLAKACVVVDVGDCVRHGLPSSRAQQQQPRRAGRLSLTIFNRFRLGGFHRTDDPRGNEKLHANQYALSAPCHRQSHSTWQCPLVYGKCRFRTTRVQRGVLQAAVYSAHIRIVQNG